MNVRYWRTSLALLTVVIIVAYGIVLERRGFSARGTPSSAEALIASTARHLAVPSEYRTLGNPLSASPETVQAGMEHFADHCATCHANDGSGDTEFGKGLYPKPPDMRKDETQHKSDGELYYIIENGVRLSGMPAFGEHPGTNDADTWRLVAFIRHLPRITTEELQAMAKLNPKTEADRFEEEQEEEFLNGSGTPETSVGAHHHH